MNKDEVRSKVCEKLRERLSEKYDIADVSIVEYTKNNGIKVEGISVKVIGCDTMPCIYSVKYDEIRTEKDLIDITDGLYDAFDKAIINAENAFIPTEIDFESSRDRIFLSLVNYEMNKDSLKSCPHILFNDLAVTFRLAFSIDESNASALISDGLADAWDVSTEELWNIAIENSVRDLPVYIERLENVLRKRMELDDITEAEIAANPFYIVTNRRLYYGASSILYNDVPDSIYENLGCNYYILPSSINELIIVPENVCCDRLFLKGMVESVNKTLCSRTEYLSDSVYYYDHDEKKISIAS